MKLGLSVDEVLTTTRSVRKRLDLSRPVSRDVIEECLDIALQAPNGANRNSWRWLVVDDPQLISRVAEQYRAAAADLTRQAPALQTPPSPEFTKMLEASVDFGATLDRVPAMLLPLMRGRPEGKNLTQQADMWGSILQAVWSFFLALRERGLGSAWTTATTAREKEIAEILGIPVDRYAQIGLFPIAYTKGTDFKKAWRKPAAEVLTYNGF